MKVLSVSLENFASYKSLNFQFDGQGLALIHGPTGSGKSTLCDAIPWVLFGVTAKGGKVDEVLSWPGNLTATGEVSLENNITIRRIRGSKAKDNDLCFWTEEGINAPCKRGKDIPDTQRLINELLGMDADLYLSGAYYHEFSKTASFFTTTAKARRELAEQLVDLSLPKSLQIKTSAARKATEVDLNNLYRKISHNDSRVEMLNERQIGLKASSVDWTAKQDKRKSQVAVKYTDFEQDQEKQIDFHQKALDALIAIIQPPESFHNRKMALNMQLAALGPETCDKCGASKHNHKQEDLRQELYSLDKERLQNETLVVKKNNHQFNIKNLLSAENTYGDQLLALDNEENPYLKLIRECAQDSSTTHGIGLKLEADQTHLRSQLNDYEILSNVINDLRANLVKNTIESLEHQTNALLTKHFDAEIRVSFATADNDKIDVTIMKNGNTAVFSQLSKGQRQLLKLCFGVSVMRTVANHHGLRFNAAFIDEALDGLSEEFKIKAYGLLQALSLDYDSLFVVEHSSELKALFEKQFEVSLTEEGSVIEET